MDTTFTNFKMFALFSRIRGYHSDRLKLPGFATGVIESYYYALPENKLKMKEYWPVSLAAPFIFFKDVSLPPLTLQLYHHRYHSS